ncbi:MAG: glycosyltransferase [Candidatus Marinimicrobia bacterium]|nr:glycosyltransferase [Candidatus Neomarinimicrobiota bacterium]
MLDKRSIFIATSVHTWNDPRIFYKEAVSLAKKYDVELHAPANFDFKEGNGVKIFGLPKWDKVSDRKKIRKELLKRINRSTADIFHFHDPELIFLGFYIKIIKRKIVIYDIHEDYYTQILLKKWIPTKFIRTIAAIIFSFIEKLICNSFDLIIFAENYYKNSYPQKIIDKSTDILNYPILNETKSIAMNNDYVKVIYTGFVSVERGAINMIKCHRVLIEKGYNVRLYLVGHLKDENIISLIEDDAELNETIKIIGKREYVDKSEIDIQYSDADIGLALISSKAHYEKKLLTKFFEYMQNEIPIVISNYDKWEKLVRDTGCGICVDPDNPIEIVNAVEYLINHPTIAKQMGKNGRKAVEEKYNWDIQAEKLITVIKSI